MPLSKEELKVFINESVKEAVDSYEKSRSAHHRFDHLPKYLTKKQVAELFGMSLGSVGNWVKYGWLQQIKVGKAVRFDRDLIIELILNGGVSKYKGLK